MKHYYLHINTHHTEVWCGDNKRANVLLKMNGLILPLGTRKPRNVSRETLKEF